MIDGIRHRWKKLSALFLSISFLFLVSTTSKAANGFVLTQSAAMEGSYKVFLCASGIRVERDGCKAYLVAKQPLWRVVFYNPVNGKAMDMTYDQWIHHESYWTPYKLDSTKVNGRRLAQPIKKIGQIKYLGQVCERYGMCKASGIVEQNKHFWGEVYGLTISTPLLPPIRILEKLYNIPHVDALPLYAKEFTGPAPVRAAGDPRALIDFYSEIWHLSTASFTNVAISEKIFVYPTNFTKVQRECDVLLDDNRKGQGKEVFDLMR